MGFWEKLFGKKQEAKDSAGNERKRVLKIEELEKLLEKKLENEKKEFLKNCGEKFKELEFSVKKALESLGEVREKDFEAEGENAYLRKIVQSSKQGFVSRMQALLEKTMPPKSEKFEESWKFCNESAFSFQQEIASFSRNIAYTGILAKKEMIEIGKSIEEVQKQLAGLKETAVQTKSGKFSKILERIAELKNAIAEKERIISGMQELEKMLSELENEKAQALKTAGELKQGQSFKDFDEKVQEKEKLFLEKKQLKEKAANLLAPLEKQLRKMQSLSESKSWVLEKEQERILPAYIHDAFNALRQDPKGEILKQVLQELKKAIEAGKITFKDEKEKGKKMQALKEIEEFDFFSEFFWKLNELDKKLAVLEEEIEKSTLFKEINALNARIESIEREAVQKSRELAALKVKEEKQKTGIAELQKIAEVESSEILEEKVEIKEQGKEAS